MFRSFLSRSVCAAAAGGLSLTTLSSFAAMSGEDGSVPSEGRGPAAPALSADEFRSFTVSAVSDVSHDTKKIRLSFGADQTLGLDIASCVVARATIDGKQVIRPYTPITPEKQKGYADVVVKGYEQGNVNKVWTSLQPGDSIELKGPFKKMSYERNMKKAIGMIAGGTGITPMYQLIQKALSDPRDRTEIRLLYANKSPEDILLKQELDALAVIYPNFKVYYTVDEAPEGWTGFTGHVNKSMAAATMPPPGDDHLVTVCGPPGMMAAVSGPLTKDWKQGEVDGVLKDMGYTSDQVFKF